jgi:hypothetical protein
MRTIKSSLPRFLLLGFAAVISGCVHGEDIRRYGGIAPGAVYVAMGSSFAAGPGIAPSANSKPAMCARSANNYAQQLAKRRGLELVDVSCSGATTSGVLDGWAGIRPQIEALTAETRLVTITIGGNDVSYIGGVMSASCRQVNSASGARCPAALPPKEERWTGLEAALRRIAAEVKQRAPKAQLIWVDYPVVLPEKRLCAATPLSPQDAGISRAIAKRLAALTARVARETGSSTLAASRLTAGHDACARDPWMNGYPVKGGKPVSAPYHPTLPGMTAIAAALDRMLDR